ncbi:hypothetical protein [Streptomyces caatingaensis]|uniref:Uncharacterized protein n=1 Tax=Streptomyces caatingaensis TaxID=1678637 RepID=A0A0K9X8M5_9ACTN|nr:hypothetical protein [Streptomyces caatingaensis]KNB49775.1 hypothetical protein AC230_23645 [Streptomyces caatingaensis]
MTMPSPPQRTPAVGELVHDARRDRIGEVTATTAGRLHLRALSGDETWEALPCDVQPTAPAPWPFRCERCQQIRRERSAALQTGDLRLAVVLTETMGIHLRQAHA